ncbi:MAG: SDR family NAD(P)-dependent oxidoreductase [Candidatus Poribacteria bacterium]|nr:SDR family NAD(P)-dependent oxidoreductase [Candidatus Poribacteria bacterium]
MVFCNDALAGIHIVISGGCGAIGVGIVKQLMAHGANLTVNDILPYPLAMDRLIQNGVDIEKVNYVKADLTDTDETDMLVGAARERFGSIHVALCHVGMVIPKPLLEYKAEEWDETMAVNVRTAFLLGSAASRSMLEDGVKGHLIFTTSWVADVPWPEIGPYNASKAAMQQLMRSFARELADEGIRANAVAPGIVSVGLAKQQWDTDPTYRARAEKAIPLGVMQPLDSVANAFLFLCSSAADYMTGTVLLVDGGCSLYPMDDA